MPAPDKSADGSEVVTFCHTLKLPVADGKPFTFSDELMWLSCDRVCVASPAKTYQWHHTAFDLLLSSVVLHHKHRINARLADWYEADDLAQWWHLPHPQLGGIAPAEELQIVGHHRIDRLIDRMEECVYL